MKIKILLLMLLLLIPTVAAYTFEGNVPAGELYNLTALPSCVGTYQMKIRGSSELLENEYSFPGCVLGEKFYECKCTETANMVTILTSPDTVNEYDIVVQYYISAKKNPDTMRVININNIQVGPVEKSFFDSLPKINSFVIYIVVAILLILLLVVFGLVMLWKMIMDSEENSIDQFTPVDHDVVVEKSKKIINETGLNKDKSDEDKDEVEDELQDILDEL